MRINKFVANASGLSRRKADELIDTGKVTVNGQVPERGQDITKTDTVSLGERVLTLPATMTIMLNKPAGYVVSREGQGSRTIYELLPPEYHSLKPIGRLDKDSSGLLLLTNDGDLANALTHPSQQKDKLYQITLYKPLKPDDKTKIEQGIQLEDGLSKLEVRDMSQESGKGSSTLDSISFEVRMHEGRNRQIRRTFAVLNYEVKTLHRTQFGDYTLDSLPSGTVKEI